MNRCTEKLHKYTGECIKRMPATGEVSGHFSFAFAVRDLFESRYPEIRSLDFYSNALLMPVATKIEGRYRYFNSLVKHLYPSSRVL